MRSRDELLDLALDSIAREYRLPPPSGDPVEDLVEVGRQARELMLRHPWVADRVVAAPVLGPHGLVVVEHVLAVLDGTPSRGQAGLELFAVLMGLVATEVLNSRQQDPADLARQVGRCRRPSRAARHPTSRRCSPARSARPATLSAGCAGWSRGWWRPTARTSAGVVVVARRRWQSRGMSTAPTCPQCGRPGVRTEQVSSTGSGDGAPRTLWLCELDHKFS